MPSIFNESGITTKSIDEFRSDLADSARVAFADKLDGKELRVDDSSVLGRIFAITAKSLAQNEEVLPLILQSLDLNSAEGQQLDNLLWNIHRVKRKSESQSTGLVMLYGDVGTYIASGSEVANNITGDSYKIDSNQTLGTISVNGIDVSIKNLGGLIKINYNIEGFLSQSPEIVIQLRTTDDTMRKAADRIVDAVNSQSSYLEAKRNNDNSVKVVIKDQSRIGSFSTTGDVTIPRSYSPAYVTSSTYNSKESTSGQINVIRTATLGWRGVTNPYYIFPSEGVEGDESYRYRGKIKQQSTSGKYTSILMALKSVGGVVYENVQQNTSANTTNSGIVNNGVAVTVMGGNEDEIALAIFNSVSEGIATSGDIVKSVKDINGFEHTIKFSRPKIVPLEISMSLITYPNFPINGNVIIRQAIIEWFNKLNVGEDIHYSRLYEPINSIQGFAVKNLKFGYKGGTLSLEDIIIRHDEIATLSAEDIIIGGSRGAKNTLDSFVARPPSPPPVTTTGNGFLKFTDTPRIDYQNATVAGITYSKNGGAKTVQIFDYLQQDHTSWIHPSLIFSGNEIGESLNFLQTPETYEENGSISPSPPLDRLGLYLFGFSPTANPEFLLGRTGAQEIENTFTFYKNSTGLIDFDLFDYIVDPKTYTQAELKYFSSRGISPATKNSDGSYTIKSKSYSEFIQEDV